MTDWTTQVADAVENIADVARERAVEPVRTVGRVLVYGLLATFFFVTALVLVSVGLFRIFVVYLPNDAWVADLVVGGIFVAGGLFCWSQREPRH